MTTLTMYQIKTIKFNEGCAYLQTQIEKLIEILEGNLKAQYSAGEYMILYTIIYNICKTNTYRLLYERYKKTFVDYISSTVLPSVTEKHGEFMLWELMKRWENNKLMIRWLSRAFYCLDFDYISDVKSLPTLNEVGLACFRELVFEEAKVKPTDVVIALIDQEREGQKIDRALVKKVIGLYVEIGMGQMEFYERHFETHVLKASAHFYSQKASNWILQYSFPDYMLKAEDCLKKEKERVAPYLQSTSKPKLLEKVQNELLAVYGSQLLKNDHSGCRILIRDDKVDDLSRMYSLFSRIPKGLDPIASIFKEHVTDEGMALVHQAEEAAINKAENVGAQEQVFVRKIIELHDKFMAYVTDCFAKHTLFLMAFKEAFEVFCNKSVGDCSSAEILASYCDNVLTKGSGNKLSDEEIEETLDKVVKVLAYISDKDLFAEFHRKKLSRRLLFDKSVNDDQERLLLSKLKQQWGGHFTSKMECMITDLALSKENDSGFKEYLSNKKASGSPRIDLTVRVLTIGSWPSYKNHHLKLPAEMEECAEAFKKFYNTEMKNRKLTWIHHLGTCHVKGNFDQKPIELILGTFQAAALLLFNESDGLSYTEIKTQLNLGDEYVVRVLQSLSCAKYKILIKEPASKTVSESDYFHFNSKFTDKMRRIKINMATVVVNEKKKVMEDVDNSRKYVIDASIVRIMKSRKVLGHQELFIECVHQLSSIFKPDVKAIKRRIEDLITREYLERDKNNPNLFRYLA